MVAVAGPVARRLVVLGAALRHLQPRGQDLAEQGSDAAEAAQSVLGVGSTRKEQARSNAAAVVEVDALAQVVHPRANLMKKLMMMMIRRMEHRAQKRRKQRNESKIQLVFSKVSAIEIRA